MRYVFLVLFYMYSSLSYSSANEKTRGIKLRLAFDPSNFAEDVALSELKMALAQEGSQSQESLEHAFLATELTSVCIELKKSKINVPVKDAQGVTSFALSSFYNSTSKCVEWAELEDKIIWDPYRRYELTLALAHATLHAIYPDDYPQGAETIWFHSASLGDRARYKKYDDIEILWQGWEIYASSQLEAKVVYFKTLAKLLAFGDALDSFLDEFSPFYSGLLPLQFAPCLSQNGQNFDLNLVHENYVCKPLVERNLCLQNESVAQEALHQLFVELSACLNEKKIDFDFRNSFNSSLFDSVLELKPKNFKELAEAVKSKEIGNRADSWYVRYFNGDIVTEHEYLEKIPSYNYYLKRPARKGSSCEAILEFSKKQKQREKELRSKVYNDLLSNKLEMLSKSLREQFRKILAEFKKLQDFEYKSHRLSVAKALEDTFFASRERLQQEDTCEIAQVVISKKIDKTLLYKDLYSTLVKWYIEDDKDDSPLRKILRIQRICKKYKNINIDELFSELKDLTIEQRSKRYQDILAELEEYEEIYLQSQSSLFLAPFLTLVELLSYEP